MTPRAGAEPSPGMTNTSDHDLDLPDDLSEDLAAYLRGYQPLALTDEQWTACRGPVLDLVTRSELNDRTDAKQVLGALCAFLAWTDLTLGTLDPAAAVTDPHIERWFLSLRGTTGEGTRSNLRSRARRILRVLSGEPARTKRQPRPAGDGPYTDAELATLAEAARDSAPLAAALEHGLGHGAARPEADPAWDRARTAAAAAGVTLTARRLRITGLVTALSDAAPLHATARAHGLSRADLEAALPHLPAVPEPGYRDLLRG